MRRRSNLKSCNVHLSSQHPCPTIIAASERSNVKYGGTHLRAKVRPHPHLSARIRIHQVDEVLDQAWSDRSQVSPQSFGSFFALPSMKAREVVDATDLSSGTNFCWAWRSRGKGRQRAQHWNMWRKRELALCAKAASRRDDAFCQAVQIPPGFRKEWR